METQMQSAHRLSVSPGDEDTSSYLEISSKDAASETSDDLKKLPNDDCTLADGSLSPRATDGTGGMPYGVVVGQYPSNLEIQDRGVAAAGEGNLVKALREALTSTTLEDTQELLVTRALFGVSDAADVSSQPSHPTTAQNTATMKIRYSRAAAGGNRPSQSSKAVRTAPLYPYSPLKHKSQTYRGYPIEGAAALKESKRGWTIQIAGAPSPHIPPPEPLPQFPQQEILIAQKQRTPTGSIQVVYQGMPGLNLTSNQIRNNIGSAYLRPGDGEPTSSSFFTSGYNPGSAVEVRKPFPQSIYHTVLAEDALTSHPVPVPVQDFKSKL